MAGDVAALGQLGERDVGGDNADEQREEDWRQRHETQRIGDGACRQPGDEHQAQHGEEAQRGRGVVARAWQARGAQHVDHERLRPHGLDKPTALEERRKGRHACDVAYSGKLCPACAHGGGAHHKEERGESRDIKQ